MADEVGTGEAAARLGTTAPTVRAMLQRGDLRGRQELRAGRDVWLIETASIADYLTARGPFARGSRVSRLEALEAEVAALRLLVVDGAAIQPGARGSELAGADMRARVINLQDALARMRTTSELQREVDAERSTVIRHLQEALAASDRADALRRRAGLELEQLLTAITVPDSA